MNEVGIDNNPEKAFINDVFWTVQGEGAHSGRAALFVRMPYCNLACSWCDTTFNTHKTWTVEEFAEFAAKTNSRFAVVTGGEPMMHKHTPRVIKWLKALGFEIACETNGTFPICEGIDFVTCSPKRDAEYDIHPQAMNKVHEFKYVVDQGFDWKILERHNTATPNVRLSLSPEFGRFQESISEILAYISTHPKWRLSLQTHKFIGVP